MRLGINATILGNERPTGVENVAVNLINSLSRRVESMIIWTINDAQLKSRNNRIEKVLQWIPHFRASTVIRAIWDQIVFPHLVKRSGVDVIFFPMQEGMLFPPVPQVVLVIDFAPLLSPEGVPLLRKLSYLTRIPWILSRSTSIITISHSVKQQLLQQYPRIDESKVKVVHLGYDGTQFNPTALTPSVLMRYGLDNAKYVLFVGSISRNKNINNIIISYLESGCSDWQLVIAGKVLNPDYKNELIQLIKDNNLGLRVRILDYVSHEDLPSLYCGASLFIFPSLYEGFGLPILEAMACGVPVITSNRYSMPEVAGDAAFLVDPECLEELAKAIREILTNSETRSQLVQKGLKRIESFTWDRAASKVFEVCEECLSPPDVTRSQSGNV